MKMAILPLLIVAAPVSAGTRSPVERDVESYAIAGCLTLQKDERLRSEGDAWASAIVQRGRGGVEPLRALQQVVAAEVARTPVAVVRVEGPVGAGTQALAIMHCAELIDRPAVRAAITQAVARLAPAYRGRR